MSAGRRPSSSRPRDALGRPLPHGSAGVPELPPDPSRTPADALSLAQQLLDDGLPFQAHEVLEEAWKAAPAPERPLWQGLAQLAVGLTHLGRGNDVGAQRVLARACTNLRGFAGEPPYDVDVTGLLAWTGELLLQVESPRATDRPAGVPRLRGR